VNRRGLITLLGSAAAACPLVARAQQRAKLPRIGFLGLVPESPTAVIGWIEIPQRSGLLPYLDVLRFKWAAPKRDTEHFRSASRTWRPAYGRLRVPQTGCTGRRVLVVITGGASANNSADRQKGNAGERCVGIVGSWGAMKHEASRACNHSRLSNVISGCRC
jgi:hypothetical protein